MDAVLGSIVVSIVVAVAGIIQALINRRGQQQIGNQLDTIHRDTNGNLTKVSDRLDAALAANVQHVERARSSARADKRKKSPRR